MALVAGGLLIVVATALHPSRETTVTILETEPRLVAAHAFFTSSYLLILLGLSGLYVAQSGRMGRLGLAGFVLSFAGTTLLAVSGNFGFLAPVLAEKAPETIDAISGYAPVVGLSGMGAMGFVFGFVMFGIAMSRTATLPRPAGILVAAGAPTYLFGFALAQFVSPGLWTLAVLGSVAFGAGLAWPGYQMWKERAFDP